MKKVIEEVDAEKKIVKITTADERWYAMPDTDPVTGLPGFRFRPSVTWIAHYYPKGIGLLRFYAQKGWDEAEQIKQAAGDKGSKVHQAFEDLVKGNAVAIDAKYVNNSTGLLEELTKEEYECVMAGNEWLTEMNPEIISTEKVLVSNEYDYAGTRDLLCRIDGKLWVLDIKTSQDIYTDMKIQVAAYKHASDDLPGGEEVNLGILQLGYRRNKEKKWKLTPIPDLFDLFLSAKKSWAYETEGVVPQQKDYPLSLQWVRKAPEAEEAKPKRSSKSTK